VNHILVTVEVLVTVVAPLLMLYRRGAWKQQTVAACATSIPILWYFVYAPMHEISHILGTYLVGGRVVDVKLIPRFWAGEVAVAWIHSEGLDNAWASLVSTISPYAIDVVSIAIGFRILQPKLTRNAFLVGFLFMFICLRPAFDLVCETVGFATGFRGDLYHIALTAGWSVTWAFLGLSIAFALSVIVAVMRRFQGFPHGDAGPASSIRTLALNDGSRAQRPPTVAERRFAEVRQQLRGLSTREVFEYIQRTNLWASSESLSGIGSELESTTRVRSELPGLLRRLGVSTLLDLPCGDFSWMSATRLPIKRYIGGDIVPSLVGRNIDAYRLSHPFASFSVLDLTSDPLPEADALFCRDCLVHLPDSHIFRAFQNISRTRISHVIMTTFLGNGRINTDIELGDWRPINFQKPPFSLPEPSIVIVEGCLEENGAYADKALGVWPVDALPRVMPAPAERMR
jgi:hypothetical protein